MCAWHFHGFETHCEENGTKQKKRTKKLFSVEKWAKNECESRGGSVMMCVRRALN